ncbi:ATPase [Micromonospora sp. SH-82]|uniref:ATPase n=1 Tax=Micromonospora sp. SH-82 TaxID=3132938 RepID=UPI003EB9BAB7
MGFSVVVNGYDQWQVDSCLRELGVGLTRLAARVDGSAAPGRLWEEVRQEADRLRGLTDSALPGAVPESTADARGQVTELLAQARGELDAAREEARRVREEAYAQALAARRECEAALQTRRRRQDRVDELLGDLTVEPVPVDTPTAAGGVPSSRTAGGGTDSPDRRR